MFNSNIMCPILKAIILIAAPVHMITMHYRQWLLYRSERFSGCHGGIQTIAIHSYTAVQTDMWKMSKQCISTQCLAKKKKGCSDGQTDEIDKMDKSSDYDHLNTTSTGVLTDLPNVVDKYVAIDPVIGRPIQTEIVKGVHKKL